MSSACRNSRRGRAGPPDADGLLPRDLGLVEAADERRDHVAVFRVVVVARAVEIGGHGADGVKAVLRAVGLTHPDPRYLGQGVGFVGGLQWAGEQVLLPDGLGAEFGIDAGRAQEKQLFDLVLPGAVDDVVLDLEVLVDELRGIGRIGVYAAHPGRRQHHIVGPLGGKEIPHGLLFQQVEFRVAAQAEPFIAGTAQGAADGAAHKATVAGDKEFSVFLQHVIASTTGRRGGAASRIPFRKGIIPRA